MTYETMEGLNASEGFHILFVYVNDVTQGLFSGMLLFALFIIVLMGSFYAKQRSTGRGDFPASFAAAGFITVTASLLMLLVPGLINTSVIAITVVVAIISVLTLALSNR